MTTEPLPWWAFRRRRARLTYLEKIAESEFRVMLNDVSKYAMTFEHAYRLMIDHGDAVHLRGLAYLNLATIRGHCPIHGEVSDSENSITLSARFPLIL